MAEVLGKVRPWAGWAGAVGLAAVLFFLGTGLHPAWPAAWLAPLPLLALAFGPRPRGLFWAGSLAFLLGGLNLAAYMVRMAPVPVFVLALVVPSVAFGLGVRWAGRAAAAGRGWLALGALPLAWVSYEFLLSRASPHGTFGSLAYTQLDFLPLLQVASVAGLSGMSFVLLLGPASLALLLVRRPELRAQGVVGMGIVVLVLGWGALRLTDSPAGPELGVALLADDARVPAFETESRDEALAALEAYAERLATLEAGAFAVAVLPEKVVGVTPAYEAEVVERLRTLARSHGIALVVGLNLLGREPSRNQALVVAADGSLLADYDKVHLVPGWEAGYQAGATPGRFELAGVPAGVAICKDLDFPRWLARYRGARLLFAPAWDFGADGWLHARMAVVRGVEIGATVVRSANEGLVHASDSRGRVVAEGRAAGRAVVVRTKVQPGPGETVYGRVGDAFAWLVVAVTGLAAVLLRQRR